MTRDWVQSSALPMPGVLVRAGTYILRNQVGKSQAQGYPQLHNKLKAGRGDIRRHSQNDCKSKLGPL